MNKHGRKLSPFMERTLVMIAATGCVAVPAGGGFWHDGKGQPLVVEPETNGSIGQVSTHTIQGLEDRGLLRRAYQHADSWKDTRVLVLPVIVLDEEKITKCRDGSERVAIVRSFLKVQDAEEWIGEQPDKDKVARGGYGIDAPEELIQAPR